MSETTVTTAPESTPETPAMTLQEAESVLSAHPIFSGMWGMAKESLDRVTLLSEQLRRVTVTDKDVTEALTTPGEFFEDPEDLEKVVSEYAEITKLREEAAKREEELRNLVKAALKGDEMTEAEETQARDEFKAERDKVMSVVGAFKKIAFSGGDDGSQEFKAIEAVLNGAPTLRGTGLKAGQKVTGADQNVIVRKWLRDNGYEVNDRGRISEENLKAYRDNHPNGHDRDPE